MPNLLTHTTTPQKRFGRCFFGGVKRRCFRSPYETWYSQQRGETGMKQGMKPGYETGYETGMKQGALFHTPE